MVLIRCLCFVLSSVEEKQRKYEWLQQKHQVGDKLMHTFRGKCLNSEAGIWCYHNTEMLQSGLWRFEHNGGGQNAGMFTEGMTVLGWVRGSSYTYINRLLERMSEDHTVMHAVSLYGNAKWCSPWGCPYFSLEAWPTCLLQPGLYRRLLYFANLLLCSAAILKRSKRKRGVGREVTETSCKETDEQEGGWGSNQSTATFSVFKRLQRAVASEQMS